MCCVRDSSHCFMLLFGGLARGTTGGSSRVRRWGVDTLCDALRDAPHQATAS